ncbi:MAG TPA: T9SS type A sorting domain-containing protein [Bacteroidetes bacterium]|nr:T9SS type A sorting domain-containing protein [Bacteroidota bacterium]
MTVIPNPFKNDEIILHSTLKHTVYKIFDLSGKKIQTGDFEGVESRVKIVVSPGIYFIRYIDKASKPAIVKIIKL